MSSFLGVVLDQNEPDGGTDRDHEKNAAFEYPWIDSTSHVRLLTITDATPSRINCTLQVKQAAELRSLQYATLSYCWGSARTNRDIHQIYVDSQPFWVRTNLWNFFQTVHNFEMRTPIYIDAICLNQLDLAERGDQVKLMSEVYSNANHTYVWLGSPHPDQEHIVQALRCQLSDGSLHDSWQTDSLVGLSLICSRVYWSRLWIVQELILSQSVSIHYGKFGFAWQDLVQLANLPLPTHNIDSEHESWWNAWSFTQPRDYSQQEAVENRLFGGWQAATRLLRHRNEWLSRASKAGEGGVSEPRPHGFSFRQALSAFRTQNCGDRKDKIFALIGLLDDEGKQMITPDYQSSSEDVFVQAAAAVIVSCWRTNAGTLNLKSLEYDSGMHCDMLNAALGLPNHDVKTRMSQAMEIAVSYINNRPDPPPRPAFGDAAESGNGLAYALQQDAQPTIRLPEPNFDSMSTETPLQLSFRMFKRELTNAERHEFAATELKELNVTLAAIQNKQRATGTLQNMTRLKTFLKATEDYGELVDTYAGEGHIVKYIWGSMKFLLQVTTRRSEAFDGLLSQYEQLGQCLPAVTQVKSLSAESSLQSEIVGVIFRNIFEFHKLALHYFKKAAWQQLFSSSWSQLKNKFQGFVKDVHDHKTLVETQANAKEMEESRQGRVETSNRLSEVLEEFRQGRREARERLERLDEYEVERRRAHLFNWLCAPDTPSDHGHLQDARKENPDGGQWVLRTSRFRAWFDPNSVTAPLLWVTGKPGAGKSVLASLVVDECRKLPGTTTLAFHCKHDDPEKSSFLGMARSILNQLLLCDDTLLMYLFDVATKRGESTLRTVKLAKEVLNTSLKTVGKTYVIIDGIDECQPVEQQQHIAKFWMKYVETSGADPEPSRCALFGQDDASTRPLFQKLPTIRIQGEHHNQDISSYCLKAADRIPKGFALTSAEKAQIASQTSQRAQGMFLFARLVMVNLAQQVTRADLEAEMAPGVFPEGVNDAYARIIERILVQAPPSYRRHAKRLLAWTACATRVLKWREIQAAVSIDLDNQVVDFERNQFSVDSKALCGALVEELPNGDVTFVHSTVKPYLLNNGYINPEEEHAMITELSLKYFCLAPFMAGCGEDVLRQAILDGTYAFAEYAMISWTTHLEEILDSSLEPKIGSSLVEALQTFFRLHWREPRKRSKPTKRINELTARIVDATIYEKVKDSMSSVHCLMSTNLSDLEAVQTSDAIMILARVRSLMETMDSQPDAIDALERFYGHRLYKCPRVYCKWFHEGFLTADDRKAHVEKHVRSHYCSTVGCVYATFGFPTAKELTKHVAEVHQPEAGPTEEEFPPETIEPEPQREEDSAMDDSQPLENANRPERLDRNDHQQAPPAEPVSQQRREPTEPARRRRRGPTSFQCTLCGKDFSRSYTLKSHMRIHSDELPFKCRECGKRFARQRDCKRHEEGHSGRKNFVCYGVLENGRIWGCRKSFAREDALKRHFRSGAGRNCEEQKQEAERRLRQEQAERTRQQREASTAYGYNTSTTMLPGIETLNNYIPHTEPQQYSDFPGMPWNYSTSNAEQEQSQFFAPFPVYGEPSSDIGNVAYSDPHSMDFIGYGQPSSSHQNPTESFRDSGYRGDSGM